MAQNDSSGLDASTPLGSQSRDSIKEGAGLKDRGEPRWLNHAGSVETGGRVFSAGGRALLALWCDV